MSLRTISSSSARCAMPSVSCCQSAASMISGKWLRAHGRRAVGDAGLAQMAVGRSEPSLDLGRCQGRKSVKEPGPDRAGRAVRADEFVGDSGQADVVTGPLRETPVTRPRLVLVIVPLIVPLAGLSHHPTLPTALPSMPERRPQVEGQGKLNCSFLRRRLDFAGGVAVILEAGQP